jgi:hypothetical protein
MVPILRSRVRTNYRIWDAASCNLDKSAESAKKLLAWCLRFSPKKGGNYMKEKTKTLAAISSLAFAGSLMVNVPLGWAQSDTTRPSSGGSESRMQKPSDQPGAESGGRSGSGGGRMSGQRLSNDKAKEVQEALKSKGFDPGTADGVIGPKTNQAIRDFQKANNLQVTGRLDEKTTSALGVAASDMGGSRSGSGRSSSMGRGGESTIPGSRGSSVDPQSKPAGKE